MRAGRNQSTSAAALAALRGTARGTENIMPVLIEAFEEYVTLGEVCDILREEWAEHRETLTI